jgi:hypothetical protein
MLYLAFLAVSFMLTYAALFVLFPLFFTGRLARPSGHSIVSLALILGGLLATFVVVVLVHEHDRVLANRVLHALGGGVLSFFVCYLVVRDTRLAIGRFQFLVFSALVVTALGVGNEILEFFFAIWLRVDFQSDGFDTWLDLISNAVGTAAGALVFVPLLGLRRPRPAVRPA